MDNKFLLGSPKDFHNFIKTLSKKDKIGIVSHTDTDGIVSGYILQGILKSRGLKINFIEFLDYGADSLKVVLRKSYNKLFFTDWNVDSYVEDFNNLRKKGNVLVIDHHLINEELRNKSGLIKTNSIYCSSHCLFDLAQEYIDTKNLEKLTCAAIIKDYVWDKSGENFNFIKNIYPEIKKDSSIWSSEPGKLGELINGALIYYRPDFQKVYDLVAKNDFKKMEKANSIVSEEINSWIEKFKEEAEHYPDKKLYFLYENPKYSITSTITSVLSSKYFPKDTIVFVSDIPEQNGFVKISSRNQTGNIDLNKILKKSIEGFENSVAGGHAKASGGNFPKKYLDRFKKNLLGEL